MGNTMVPVIKKKFKYNDEILQPGQVFEPSGGKFDEQILDPDNGFIRLERQREPVAVAEPAPEMFACPDCEREFTTPQGLTAHSRVHKKVKT